MQQVNVYDQEMPQSPNADQTMAHWTLIITWHQKVIKVIERNENYVVKKTEN